MTVILNRQQEVIDRSTHRLVTAMIYMVAPFEASETMDPKSFGLIIEKDNQPLSVVANETFIQGVHLWQNEDHCVPKVVSDPRLLDEILQAMKERGRKIDSGDLSAWGVGNDDQLNLFGSSDLINKATGIPRQLTITFTDVGKDIGTVPFPRLKAYLALLQEKLTKIGGRLHSAEIAHVPAISASDYYKLPQNPLVTGFDLNYGEIMLAKGHNALVEAGVPNISPLKKLLN